MPLPDLNTYCTKLTPAGELCVTFPGGATMCAMFPEARIPDPSELTASFMGQLNGALMPLVPIFDVIDVLVAIVNCVKAVEKALGPPPDPSKLVQCFPDLAKKLAKLLQIIPQLSVPLMIGGILDVLIGYFTGLKGQMLAIVRQQLRIALAQTRAASLGSVALHTAVDCADADLEAYLANLNAQAAPVGRLIALLNALLDLAGLPEVPAINSLGSDAQAAVAPITATIELLQTIRQGLP